MPPWAQYASPPEVLFTNSIHIEHSPVCAMTHLVVAVYQYWLFIQRFVVYTGWAKNGLFFESL